MFYFYCPNCGKEDVVEKLPWGTVGNIRDGFGTLIHHYECSNCHNLDAGFMSLCRYEEEDYNGAKRYFRSVIGIYQHIRGFNTNN